MLNEEQARSPAAAWAETIKASVGPVWTNAVVKAAAQNDKDGCLYSRQNRITVVEFVVESDGRISDVHIAASSGVEYLDKVAVDAFRTLKQVSPPPAATLKGHPSVELPFKFTLLATPRSYRCPPRWNHPAG